VQDFEPAVHEMVAVVRGIDDDQLTDPTPCPDYTVGDLLDHVAGVARAFAAAAAKEQGINASPPPPGDAARLTDDWRTRIPIDLQALVPAWADPDAWDGMTWIGGGETPGGVAAAIGLEELVAHGWDLARATGQPFAADPATVEVCIDVMVPISQPGMEEARQPAFGPVVAGDAGASPLHELLGLTGRDPGWTAAGGRDGAS
jgi:uncharacterized protein (TIGR03086 family)